MNNLIHLGNPLINTAYLTISILGKNYRLDIKYKNISKIELNKLTNKIEIILPKTYKNIDNTSIINSAIQKMYQTIAEKEIDNAMEIVRYILKFAPEDYKLAQIKNACYKCSSDKTIIINPEIVKYNQETIITTLIQAFCRNQFKLNSTKYKTHLTEGLAKYEDYKNKYNQMQQKVHIS